MAEKDELSKRQEDRLEKATALAYQQARNAVEVANAQGWSDAALVAALVTAIASNYATLRTLND